MSTNNKPRNTQAVQDVSAIKLAMLHSIYSIETGLPGPEAQKVRATYLEFSSKLDLIINKLEIPA